MNDCIETEVRDALPDLIHGRLSDLDTATLTAHVESCADCRAEMELLRQFNASAPLAPKMDVARIVASLPLPMPSAAGLVTPAPSRTKSATRRSFMWKTASVAALLVVGSLTFANVHRQSAAVATVQTAAPGAVPFRVASVPELTPAVVAAAAAREAAAAPVAAAPAPSRSVGLSLTGGVQDLTDDQLQALVNGLDNVKALPSAEPEAVAIGVDDSEGMQ